MLTCYVNGQCLTIKQPIVAADTIDYITAEFIFRTNEWDGLTKIAVFRQGEVTHTALLVDDKIEADAHVNLTEGDWEVGLIGESIDGEEIVRRITTELKTISVDRAAPNGGDPFPEYAGGVGEQIVAKAAEYMESARDAESSASMHAMIANSAANLAANERYFAEEAKEQAVAAKDAAVDAKEYIEGIAIDIGIIGELITKDIGDWYHYDHTSDVTYSANFLKTGSTIKSWPEATMMRSAISPVRTVGDDLYIFAFGYKWTRESMAMLPMEVFATIEQLYRRFLIDDKVVTYGVREALTKDIYVVSFGYKQDKWFYTNTRMDGSKIEAYWDEGSLDFSSFVVRYSDAATPYADDVDLDDDTLKAIQSKLDISTKLSELDTDTEHRTVTDAEKAAWNAKSNFSGFYYDLIGKPSIPNKLASLEQDSTHRTVTDAEKAIWNSQSAPFTSNLLKGDGRGGMTEATPGRDYVDYNRDAGLSMVKSSYSLTSRTNFSVIAGDTTKIGGGTLLLKGYQKIETETPEIELEAPEIKIESPSATLNGKDIATVDDIPSNLSDLSDDAEHRTVTDDEKAAWNEKANKSDVAVAAGNWYRYDVGDLGIIFFDYLIDGSSITDWAAATSLPSFLAPPPATLGYDLFDIVTYWDRESVLSLRPRLIEIYNLLEEHELLSSNSVYYRVRLGVTSMPITVFFTKRDGPYRFSLEQMGGRRLEAVWREGAADFSGFGLSYSHYPYADDVYLSADQKAAIQSKLGISTKLSELETDVDHRTVTDTEKAAWNDKSDFSGSYNDLSDKPNIPTNLSDLSDDVDHRTVTDTEKAAWNDKYSKPSGGIPKNDLASVVQASLEKADSAVQPTERVFMSGDMGVITLADNTEYYLTPNPEAGDFNVEFVFPDGDFHCWVRLTYGDTGDIVIPSTAKYIGEAPQFENGQTWELDIKDGVIVAGKVE